MDKLGIINRRKTAFVLIDMQEKLVPAIHEKEQVISNANILLRVSEILDIPLMVTEQYPKGLGHTFKNIVVPRKKYLIEKTNFSCFGSGAFINRVEELKVDSVVLFGVEAHVCVLETALDALKSNYDAYVVADAVSSRTAQNKSIAVERMRQSGVFIVSTEMVAFQLLERADTQEFRCISRLIK